MSRGRSGRLVGAPEPGVSVEAGGDGGPLADTTPPTITSSNTDTVAENSVLAHALTANESVTWSIVGGADQARFELSGSTLRWLSNGTKDYEAPNDADTNNTYIVTVRATDLASNTTDQTITVTVTDVSEAPSYGPELVVNGSFATNSDWSGSGWSIAAGVYTGVASSLPKTGTNTSAANLEIGATYHTVFTLTAVSAGGVSVLVGGAAGTLQTTPGTYTEDIVCDDTFPPRMRTDFGPSTTSVDNVSFKKVL